MKDRRDWLIRDAGPVRKLTFVCVTADAASAEAAVKRPIKMNSDFLSMIVSSISV